MQLQVALAMTRLLLDLQDVEIMSTSSQVNAISGLSVYIMSNLYRMPYWMPSLTSHLEKPRTTTTYK